MVRPNNLQHQQESGQGYVLNNTNDSQGNPRDQRPTQPRNSRRNSNQSGTPNHMNNMRMPNTTGNCHHHHNIVYSPHPNNANGPRPFYFPNQIPANIHPNSQQMNMYQVPHQMTQMPYSPQSGAPPFHQTQHYFHGYPRIPGPIFFSTDMLTFPPGATHAQMAPFCYSPPLALPPEAIEALPPEATEALPPEATEALPPQVPCQESVTPDIPVIDPPPKRKRRQYAITDIKHPVTGINIADEIYGPDDDTPTPPPPGLQEQRLENSIIKVTQSNTSHPSNQHQKSAWTHVERIELVNQVVEEKINNSPPEIKREANPQVQAEVVPEVKIEVKAAAVQDKVKFAPVRKVNLSKAKKKKNKKKLKNADVNRNPPQNKRTSSEDSAISASLMNKSAVVQDNNKSITQIDISTQEDKIVEVQEQQDNQDMEYNHIKAASDSPVQGLRQPIVNKENQYSEAKLFFLSNDNIYSGEPTVNKFIESMDDITVALLNDAINTPRLIGENLESIVGECGMNFLVDEIIKDEELVSEIKINELESKPILQLKKEVVVNEDKPLIDTQDIIKENEQEMLIDPVQLEETTQEPAVIKNETLEYELQTEGKVDEISESVMQPVEKVAEILETEMLPENKVVERSELQSEEKVEEISEYELQAEEKVAEILETERLPEDKVVEISKSEIRSAEKIAEKSESELQSEEKIEEISELQSEEKVEEISESELQAEGKVAEIFEPEMQPEGKVVEKSESEIQPKEKVDEVCESKIQLEEKIVESMVKIEISEIELEEKSTPITPVTKKGENKFFAEIVPFESNNCEATRHAKGASPSVHNKKIYSRDFIVSFQHEPLSNIRLDLPNMDYIKRNPKDVQAPPPTQPPQNRRNYQGRPNRPQEIIHVSISKNNVDLRRSENAWIPLCKRKQELSKDESKAEKIYQTVRGTLNKLTPNSIKRLVSKLQQLKIDTEELLRGVIDIVYQKAIDEPKFAASYALMCTELATIKVLVCDEERNITGKEYVDFRKLLIINCQLEFERSNTDEAAHNDKLNEIAACEDVEKKKEMELLFEEENRRIKSRYLGNIQFIGELYKQKMLTRKIMGFCITRLLATPDSENIEFLCKLLATIGKIYDENYQNGETNLSVYLEILNKAKDEKNADNEYVHCPRIRFMVQDTIDLRMNMWVSRGVDNSPKTIAEIIQQAENEQNAKNGKKKNDKPSKDGEKENDQNDQCGRNDSSVDNSNDRRRGQGGSNATVDNGGWSCIPSRHKPSPYLIQTSKLRHDTSALTLGARNMEQWRNGASGGKSNVTPNKFAALDMSEPRYFSNSYSNTYTSDNKCNDRRSDIQNNNQTRSGNIENVQSEHLCTLPPPVTAKVPSLPIPPTVTPPALSSKPALIVNYTADDEVKPAPIVDDSADDEVVPRSQAEEKQRVLVHTIIDECNFGKDADLLITAAIYNIVESFEETSYPLFVEEGVSFVLDKKPGERKRFSSLLVRMLKEQTFSLAIVQNGCEKVFEISEDLALDVPQCYKYIAEILFEMVVAEVHPFAEFKNTLLILKNAGICGKVLGEVLSLCVQHKDPEWVIDHWNQSGLVWDDLLNPEMEIIDDFLTKYNLRFLARGLNNNNMD